MQKTMFFPPKNKWLANIISLRSPQLARISARELLSEFKSAKTRAKKRKIKRATVLASNRAKAMLKRRNLSAKERKEFAEISKIYRNTANKMRL